MLVPARIAEAASRLLHSPQRPSLWGDGFEDDAFRHIASVSDWDEIDDDELVRFYPRLLCKPTRRLIDHLERCVATLFVQCGARGSTLRSMPMARASCLAVSHAPFWSPAPAASYLDRLRQNNLSALDDFLLQLKDGEKPFFRADLAENVAANTAIHPAYFWLQVVPSHQLFTTLGWLGIVLRGRPALMPYDVAEYLRAALDGEMDEKQSLVTILGSRRMAQSYQRQAKRRLQGRAVVARDRRSAFWFPRFVGCSA